MSPVTASRSRSAPPEQRLDDDVERDACGVRQQRRGAPLEREQGVAARECVAVHRRHEALERLRPEHRREQSTLTPPRCAVRGQQPAPHRRHEDALGDEGAAERVVGVEQHGARELGTGDVHERAAEEPHAAYARLVHVGRPPPRGVSRHDGEAAQRRVGHRGRDDQLRAPGASAVHVRRLRVDAGDAARVVRETSLLGARVVTSRDRLIRPAVQIRSNTRRVVLHPGVLAGAAVRAPRVEQHLSGRRDTSRARTGHPRNAAQSTGHRAMPGKATRKASARICSPMKGSSERKMSPSEMSGGATDFK